MKNLSPKTKIVWATHNFKDIALEWWNSYKVEKNGRILLQHSKEYSYHNSTMRRSTKSIIHFNMAP